MTCKMNTKSTKTGGQAAPAHLTFCGCRYEFLWTQEININWGRKSIMTYIYGYERMKLFYYVILSENEYEY